jgi:hypothetical protein
MDTKPIVLFLSFELRVLSFGLTQNSKPVTQNPKILRGDDCKQPSPLSKKRVSTLNLLVGAVVTTFGSIKNKKDYKFCFCKGAIAVVQSVCKVRIFFKTNI